MKLSKEEVKHVAKLVRLVFTVVEVEWCRDITKQTQECKAIPCWKYQETDLFYSLTQPEGLNPQSSKFLI